MKDRRVSITIISTVEVYFSPLAYFSQDGQEILKFRGQVYEGGIRVYAESNEDETEVRANVLAWIYENYNVPLNLEKSDLLYHQPGDAR